MSILGFITGTKTTLPTEATVIYSRMGCKYCARAKALLKASNIPYEDRSVNEKQYHQELLYLMKERGVAMKDITLPQIWIRGQYIGGEEALEKYLSSKV